MKVRDKNIELVATLKTPSLPPYMYVERDIESGFGGRLDKIINNRIEQILRK